MLFSIIFVGWFVIKFKARIVFSFSNINLIIPLCQRVTYFHQLKILTAKNIRFKTFRFIIRRFLIPSNIFIFQTSYVKKNFIHTFGKCKSEVCWPGVHLPPKSLPILNKEKLSAIIPYAYIDLPQKNFQFFSKINWKHFTKLDRVFIPSEIHHNENSVFEFIGNLSREQMNELYLKGDLLFVSSLEETVCLPIFEFASTGKPVLVLAAPYIVEIAKEMKLPKNIILFNQDKFEEVLTKVLLDYSSYFEQNEVQIKSMQISHWPCFR